MRQSLERPGIGELAQPPDHRLLITTLICRSGRSWAVCSGTWRASSLGGLRMLGGQKIRMMYKMGARVCVVFFWPPCAPNIYAHAGRRWHVSLEIVNKCAHNNKNNRQFSNPVGVHRRRVRKQGVIIINIDLTTGYVAQSQWEFFVTLRKATNHT